MSITFILATTCMYVSEYSKLSIKCTCLWFSNDSLIKHLALGVVPSLCSR